MFLVLCFRSACAAYPLPLTLSIGQLPRGFTYFSWWPLLAHLLFALLLGVLSFAFPLILSRGPTSGNQAAMTGRIAAAINIGAVAILSVDSVLVGIWLLVAGLVSFMITSCSARAAAFLWRWGTSRTSATRP